MSKLIKRDSLLRLGRGLNISADGTVVAKGGFLEDPSTALYDRVIIFDQIPGTVDWTVRDEVVPGVVIEDDFYGETVSLSADGGVLAVGAPGVSLPGRVHIYQQQGGAWVETNMLLAPDGDITFGTTVLLAPDGERIAIGAHFEAATEVTNAGNVEFYHIDAVTVGGGATGGGGIAADITGGVAPVVDPITLPASTLTVDADGSDWGHSVATTTDSSVLAVSAPGAIVGGVSRAGHVLVYDWSIATTAWVLRDTITATTPRNDGYYGSNIELSDNGSVLAISAVNHEVNGKVSGGIDVWDYNGVQWVLRKTLIAAVPHEGDEWGLAFGMEGLGTTICAFAPVDSKVYAFDWVSDAMGWIRRPTTIEVDGGVHGNSLDLTNRGTTLALGQPDGNDVTIYDWNGVRWDARGPLTATAFATTGRFGHSVSLSANGTTLAVGALETAVDGVTEAGLVYTYTWDHNQSIWVARLSVTSTSPASEQHWGLGTAVGHHGNVVVVTGHYYLEIFGTGVTVDGVSGLSAFLNPPVPSLVPWAVTTGPHAGDNALYGTAVATTADSSIMAVGAPGNGGHIHLYDWSIANDSYVERIGSSLPGTGVEMFSSSLSISDDGSVLVIGSSNANNGQGVVQIYDWLGISWIERGEITLPTPVAIDNFGMAISLSGDGLILTAAAPGRGNMGAVYTYDWTDHTWILRDTLLGSISGGRFGTSLDVSSNGTILSVGLLDTDESGFVRTYGWNGSTWAVRGSNLYSVLPTPGARFGGAVALSSDGLLLAVGEVYDGGAVYTYAWNTVTSTWDSNEVIVETYTNDGYGTGLCINPNGTAVIVGAPLIDSIYHYGVKPTISGVSVVSTHPITVRINEANYWNRLLYREGTTSHSIGQAVACNIDGTVIATLSHTIPLHGISTSVVLIYDWDGTGYVLRNYIPEAFAGTLNGLALTSDGSRLAMGVNVPGTDSNQGGVYIYDQRLDNTGWDHTVTIIPTDTSSSLTFGSSIAWNGDSSQMVIGSTNGTAPNGDRSGRVDSFDINGNFWTLTNILYHSDHGSRFGCSIALSDDGLRMVVGALRSSVDGGEKNGRAYVFNRYGSYWSNSSTLRRNTPGDEEYFGSGVSMSGDGNTITVSAFDMTSDDVPGGLTAIYQWSASLNLWAIEGFISGPDTQTNDRLGYSSVMSRNGKTLLLGATAVDVAVSSTGAVLFYGTKPTADVATPNRMVPYDYTHRLTLTTDVTSHELDYGSSVTFSDNGQLLAVGVIHDDVAINGAGVVHIYAWDGTTYNRRARVYTDLPLASDRIGYSVSFAENGSVLVIGATGAHNGNVGGAFVYDWTGIRYRQRSIFVGDTYDDNLGSGVAISDNGLVLAIGVKYEDTVGNGAGAVRTFTWNTGSESWTESAKLTSPAPQAGNRFGDSVSISADGTILAVGAATGEGLTNNTGVVFIFKRSGSTWIQGDAPVFKLANATSGQFGRGVSISDDGTRLTVGAAGTNDGHVYIYTYSVVTLSWELVESFNDTTTIASDHFGTAVGTDASGRLLAVGAPHVSFGGYGKVGRAYIYGELPTEVIATNVSSFLPPPTITNTEVSTFTDSRAMMGDQFGQAIAVSNDGGLTVISNSGGMTRSVYTYLWDRLTFVNVATASVLTDMGMSWGTAVALSNNGAILVVSNPLMYKVETYDWSVGDEQWVYRCTVLCDRILSAYGTSLALSSNGLQLFVGVPREAGEIGEVYVYEWNDTNWAFITSIIPANIPVNEWFGKAIALGGNDGTLVISASVEDGGDGRIYTYDLVGGMWVDRGVVLEHAGTTSTDNYGGSLSLSEDALVMAVGASKVPSAYGVDSGTIFVYDWNAGTISWDIRTEDLNADQMKYFEDDQVGHAVALTGDGLYMTFSAIASPKGTVFGYGVTPVLDLIPTITRTLHTTLTSPSISPETKLGTSVVISGDNQVLVAAALNDATIPNDAGVVYTYDWDIPSGGWKSHSQILKDQHPTVSDRFGKGLAISGNADVLAVGVPNHVNPDGTVGCVYTYKRSTYTGQWLLQPVTLEGDTHFGTATALSSDGRVLVVGCPDTLGGSIYTYVWDIQSEDWVVATQILTANTVISGDHFGYTLDITPAGNKIVVGTTGDRVYVYDRIGVVWNERSEILTGPTDVTLWGRTVSISNNANIVSVGGSSTDGELVVYVYDWNSGNSTWIPRQLHLESGLDNSIGLNGSVNLTDDGETIAIGAPSDDTDGNNVGILQTYGDRPCPVALLTPVTSHETIVNAVGLSAGDSFGSSIALSTDRSRLVVGAPNVSVDGNAAAGVVYTYDWNGVTWITAGLPLSTETPFINSHFGTAVSICHSGNRLVVGSTELGTITTYDWDNLTRKWVKFGFELTVVPSISGFGGTVGLSGDGQVMSVGVPTDSDVINEGGSVYTYTWDTLLFEWIQDSNPIRMATPIDTMLYGASVSLNMKGTYLMVGASQGNDASAAHGSVYYYNRNTANTTWSLGGSISDPSPVPNVYFGHAISMTPDGIHLAVGSYKADYWGVSSGSVGVYTLIDGTWTFDYNLETDIIDGGDYFGSAVGFVDDLIVVGAPNLGTGGGLLTFGNVPIVKPDINVSELGNISGIAKGQFGRSSAISYDGHKLISGASTETSDGYVHTYIWNGGGYIEQLPKLGSAVANSGNAFGVGVALSADGLILAVANAVDDGYINTYDWNATTSGWDIRSNVVNTPLIADNKFLGSGMAMSKDGQILIAGAKGRSGGDAGYVATYDWNAATLVWDMRSNLLFAPDSHKTYGVSVEISLDKTRIFVGSTGGSGTIRTYTWDNPSATWMSDGPELHPCNATQGDQFGTAVVISNDSQTLYVGGKNVDAMGIDKVGAMYTYNWVNGIWALATIQTKMFSESKDYYGRSLALSKDMLVIGGTGVYYDGDNNSGRVKMFGRYPSTYPFSNNYVAKVIHNPAPVANDFFGDDTALSADNHTLIISGRGIGGVGGIYTYDWDGGDYVISQPILLEPTGTIFNVSGFGSAITLSADGLDLFTASQDAIISATGVKTGTLFQYRRVDSKSPWVYIRHISNVDDTIEHRLGSALSVSADGLVLVAGANKRANGAIVKVGGVFTWDWDGSAWIERSQPTFHYNVVDSDILFGYSVDLSPDGNTLYVGSRFGGTGNVGEVHVYNWNSGTTSWDLDVSLSPTGNTSAINHGAGVAVNSDQTRLYTCAFSDIAPGGVNSGTVTVWHFEGGSWIEQPDKLYMSPGAGDAFGIGMSIAPDDSMLVIPAFFNDDDASNSGKVYITGTLPKNN